MFQTTNHARLKLPFLGKEESAWAYAELLINSSWLFADCLIKEDNLQIRSSYLLASPKQLKLLIESDEVEIFAIYLVSPPQMNFSDNWKMEVVDRICTGQANVNEFRTAIEIYELKNGNKYFTHDPSEAGEIENTEVVFSS